MSARSAALLAVLVLAAGCGRRADSPRADAPPMPVEAGVVAQIDWPSAWEAGGVVRASLTASIASRMVAPVLSVHVTAGSRIRRGQPLVTLDARELRAQAAGAAAAEAAARDGAQAAAAHEAAAESALTLARATHERIRALHETRSATPQELDAAAAAFSGATAQLTAARAQATAAAFGLEAAQAAAEAARVGLSYAVLTAPFDGVVASRSADPGALATPGMELLTVESDGSYRLDVAVDESRRGRVAPGDPVEVALDTSGQWTPARVREIGRIDPRQHSFVVKIDLPASDGMYSGAFGRARLFGDPRRTLAAPAQAVVRHGQLWTAFTIDRGDIARLRVLTPGEARGRDVEILAGLEAGERVVLSPPPALTDGMRVRAKPATAGESAAAGASQ